MLITSEKDLRKTVAGFAFLLGVVKKQFLEPWVMRK